MRTTALADHSPSAEPRRLRLHPSARLRILGWYAVLLVVALASALILQWTFLRTQLDAEVGRDLTLEVDQLRQVIEETDPATGALLHVKVAEVFDTHLERAVLPEGEVVFTLVSGRPYKSTVTPVQLLDEPVLVERWASATETMSGESESVEGPVRWVAVPLREDGVVTGTFIVANFLANERAEVDEAVRVGALVFMAVAVIATALAWLIAGRILRPIRLLTETAQEIGESDWSRRIAVEGEDEIAELARTFNAMLDRLETAFRTQRRFIDDAGHELWTPITIIRGHLEVMSDDPTDLAATRTVVLDELDRMSRMVDDLLVLAKAQQPDFIVPGEVDVADLTVDLVRKADGLADRNWTVEATGEGLVIADRQRIVQAVMNLVRNAIAYAEPGTYLGLGTSVDDGVFRVWVHDEGPGIAPDDRARLFERFARGSTGARKTDGAGLGLSIVEAIATAHGGRLELESVVGEGSTFTLVLPAPSVSGDLPAASGTGA